MNQPNNIQLGIHDSKHEDYSQVSLDELQRPKDGFVCYLNRYWLVHNGNALFYGNSPQCNKDKRVVEYCLKSNLNADNLECVFVPIAYVSNWS